MAPRKPVEKTRRSPQRRGSKVTVDTIFQATARILERDGIAALNTNRIAEVAGVSIGALYGYFPDKQAILVAMARRQLDADREAVLGAIAPVVEDPDAPVERIAIRAVIAAYAHHTKVRQLIMQNMFATGLGAEVTQPTREVAELLSRRFAGLAGPGRSAPSSARLFIVTCAVEAAVRAAAYERMPFFGTPEFEDELVRLVLGFLGMSGDSLAPPSS